MNKFMRLFAVLLVVAAIVLIVVAIKLGGHKAPVPVAANQVPTIDATRTPAKATYDVVTAAAALQPGVAITTDQLAVTSSSRKIAGSYDAVDKVVGKVPAIPVARGSLLTKNILIHGLSLKLQPGERAMAVPVTKVTGMANRIHPGDYVDLFFSLKPQGQGEAALKRAQSRLLLPRLRVLAFGSDDLPRAATPATAASGGKAKAVADAQREDRGTAVLAVPVNKVNRLLLILSNPYSTLSLVLRNPNDKGMPDPSLFPQPGPVLLARAPSRKASAMDGADPDSNPDSADNQAYAGISLGGLMKGDTTRRRRPARHHTPSVHRVEVIRGTQRDHITVPNH